MPKNLYTAHATTTAGREGKSATDDGQVALQMSKPGSGKPGSNPEQLFAMGYSACFGGAIEAVAKKQGINPGTISVTADVELNQDDEGGYFLAVTLNANLSEADAATAQKLVEAAHHVCPYSKATRGNINVTLNANGSSVAQAA